MKKNNIFYGKSKAEISAMARDARQKALDRMVKKSKAADRAKEKLSRGDRLTIAEFEAYTGIMFSHSMTGKLDNVLSLSTSCACNNRCVARMKNPDLICSECFAIDTQSNYKGVFENTALNAAILSKEVLPINLWPDLNTDILRIESFGDVINVVHAINYINLTYQNPKTTVTAWTKNPDLWVKAFKKVGKPANLIFGISSDRKNEIMEIKPELRPYVNFVFTVYELDYLLSKNIDPETFINCGGRSCRGCMKCYNLPFMRTSSGPVYVSELVKADAKRARKMGINV